MFDMSISLFSFYRNVSEIVRIGRIGRMCSDFHSVRNCRLCASCSRYPNRKFQEISKKQKKNVSSFFFFFLRRSSRCGNSNKISAAKQTSKRKLERNFIGYFLLWLKPQKKRENFKLLFSAKSFFRHF